MKPFDSGHEDLVHDVVYDFYGRYVATCSSDQHIKVFKADKETNKWELSDSWKAHDSSIVAIDWASPEFGRIIASVSYDKTLKIWEENPDQEECSGRRWNQLCVLNDSRGALYDVKFAPPHLGLKLATIGNDGSLRIYEALEPSDLRSWTLTTEINILKVPPANHLQSDFGLSWCPSRFSAERLAVCVLDQAIIYEKVSNDNTINNNNTILRSKKKKGRGSSGNGVIFDRSHPADVNRQRNQDVDIVFEEDDDDNDNNNQYNNYNDIDVASENGNDNNDLDDDIENMDEINVDDNDNNKKSNANKYQVVAKLEGHRGLIRSISWAPSIGRWYQLIATGSKDGNVRIFKLSEKTVNSIIDNGNISNQARLNNNPGYSQVNGNDNDINMDKDDDPLKSGSNKSNSNLLVELLSEHDDHNGEVWSVSWNLTGTILSSAGDDGKVRLWKSTYSNEFKCMSVITAQQQ